MKALFWRDLKLAVASGGGVWLTCVFFAILVVMIPFGVGSERGVLVRIAPGVIWVAALLATFLSLDRIFASDAEDGSLEVLAQSPLPLEALTLIKALAHWITTCVPLVVIAPILGAMLGMPFVSLGPLVLSLLLGTPALSAIGTFGAALVLFVARGGMLLSILVLPFAFPTLIFGTTAITSVLSGSGEMTPFLMLAGISLGSVGLMPFASSAVLRFGLR
ncbi:MAG: heme exporter protein CcmB [Pseudomonadota bacterium]